MRRPHAPAASLVVLAAVGVTGLAAAPAHAAQSACAPETGDWCTSVAAKKGRRYLELSTFSFRGTVEICVAGPKRRSCRSTPLRRQAHDVYRARLRWSTAFPDQGRGRYRVTFAPSVTGKQLGPTLSFRVR
jgi:hypothetical protein